MCSMIPQTKVHLSMGRRHRTRLHEDYATSANVESYQGILETGDLTGTEQCRLGVQFEAVGHQLSPHFGREH